MKSLSKLLILLSAAIVITVQSQGCSNPAITNTSRNVVEQMLLSTAIERCVDQFDVYEFRGQKVFIDYANLATQADQPYAKGQFELHLSKAGLVIAKEEKDADLTMRLISGTLATEADQLLIGTPPLPIPVPDTTISLVIPELALFKRLIRSSSGKFSLTILDSKTQRPLRVIENVRAKTEFINWIVMFIPFTSKNMEMAQSDNGEVNYDIFE